MDTMRHKIVQVIAHRNAVSLANERLWQAVRDAFPVGSDIAWEIRHNLLCRGKVVEHAYEKVGVINAKTGVRMWITDYQIAKAADYDI